MQKTEDSKILVSVICCTYNHEKYIRRSLESIMEQKGDFALEVLVHDDASTDGTAAIIKEFEKKYPDVIKPIYQKENQYSKNPSIVNEIQQNRVQGEYVAYCEGDDYWCDPNKICKQLEAMKKHPNQKMCAHGAYIYQNDSCTGKVTPFERDKIITIEDIINCGGGYIATCSWMLRSEVLHDMPKFVQIYPIDYTYQIYGSMFGGILYLGEIMSVYNYMTTGSWSRQRKIDVNFSIKVNTKLIDMYRELDKYTNQIYHTIIQRKIIYYEYEILWYQGKIKEIKRNKQIYSTLNHREKLKLYFRLFLPSIYNRLWKRKYKL